LNICVILEKKVPIVPKPNIDIIDTMKT